MLIMSLAIDRQMPVILSHLSKCFLAAMVGFPQGISQGIRVTLQPLWMIFWIANGNLPVR
jgi:hypothetical protein